MPRLRVSVPIAAGVLGVGIAAYGGVAGAAPQPTTSQVRQQVNSLTSQYDRASQQYDAAAQQLSAANSELAQLGKQTARDETRFKALRTDVAQIAAASYEDSSLSSAAALLTTGNPQAVLGKASLLLELSSSRNTQMHQFLDAARQLSASQQRQQRTEYALAALERQRSGTRQHLAQLLASKKATLASLTVTQAQAVAATSIGSGGTTTATYTGATSTQGEQAVAFAYAQLGKPYAWGATGPSSYDCSGLVQAAWEAAGVSIPRDTYEQWAALPHISMSALEPGDLIFYDGEGHVAMYVGDGYIIDAPQTGESIRKLASSTSWYAGNADGAVRP
jgi:cell wall-associated NlpC family hydrolase/outer membrane murein-binding lipoprotein Lpp